MFAGCIEFQQGLGLGQSLLKLAENELAEIPYDDKGIWQNGSVTLVQQRQWNTAESKQDKGLVEDASGTQILSWSRIDNRPELLEELSLAQSTTDTELILAAWQQWHEDVCQYLIGDFAFAIYDPAKQQLYLGRDHLGVRPLYFYQDDNCFLFATSLAVLDELLELKLSKDWMARYVVGCSQDWVLTPFVGIEKVPPSHYIKLDLTGSLSLHYRLNKKPYFEFSDQITPMGFDEAVSTYRTLLERSVADRLRLDSSATYAVGSESSGGLDSSSVIALASRLMAQSNSMNPPEESLYGYSMQTCVDEPACVDKVTEEVKQKELFVLGSDAMSADDWDQGRCAQERSLGMPMEHGTSVSHKAFFEHAQSHNVRTMLSGFGGDEFTTTYATTALVEFWQNGQFMLWLGRFRGSFLTSKLRALKWLFRHLRYGPGTETAQKLIASAAKRIKASPLMDELKTDSRLKNASYNQAKYDMGCASLNEFTLSNRWSPLMTARFENSLMMAARHRIEYRWPLLDIRLLTFFLSVPAEHKLGPKGLGRYLHRCSMEGLLPEEILWRDKDMGGPLATAKNLESEDRLDSISNKKKLKILNINNNLKEILNVNLYIEFASSFKQKEVSLDASKVWMIQQITALNDWLSTRDKRLSSNSDD